MGHTKDACKRDMEKEKTKKEIKGSKLLEQLNSNVASTSGTKDNAGEEPKMFERPVYVCVAFQAPSAPSSPKSNLPDNEAFKENTFEESNANLAEVIKETLLRGQIPILMRTISNQWCLWRRMYTWTNGKHSQRLDRVFCDQHCFDVFPVLNVRHLSKTGSDHSPLLLELKFIHDIPKGSFRFQNMWLKSDQLAEVVATTWCKPIFGNPLFVLQSKLKALKQVLREWNKEVFGNIFTQAKSVEEKVMVCEKIYESSRLDVDRQALHKARVEHLHSLAIEEEYWRQHIYLLHSSL
ncbi:hypothetical protein LIER_40758 [Lithospermum erythrorhizon]|uniref:Uncharacterized protein n=1 Tax=Lithospermum erythrorhizon TaxID=34254 RepID=A0AAV3QZG7_LITER